VTTPRVFLAGSTEAQALLDVTEEVMHNAEKVVDEGWLARDDLVSQREERIWIAVIQCRRGTVCTARRRYEEVIVLRNVEDGFARGMIRLLCGSKLDMYACALDELPLCQRLFAKSLVGCKDGRVIGLVFGFIVEFRYPLCASYV
jgi:hypothetical protein